jgi:hypothetical protein
MNLKERLKRVNPSYPPVIFICKLEDVLKEQLGDEYDPAKVARAMGLTPITMAAILRGCTVKLENALRLAEMVKVPVAELWRLK